MPHYDQSRRDVFHYLPSVLVLGIATLIARLGFRRRSSVPRWAKSRQEIFTPLCLQSLRLDVRLGQRWIRIIRPPIPDNAPRVCPFVPGAASKT